jgi:hypothetical protein
MSNSEDILPLIKNQVLTIVPDAKVMLLVVGRRGDQHPKATGIF